MKNYTKDENTVAVSIDSHELDTSTYVFKSHNLIESGYNFTSGYYGGVLLHKSDSSQVEEGEYFDSGKNLLDKNEEYSYKENKISQYLLLIKRGSLSNLSNFETAPKLNNIEKQP